MTAPIVNRPGTLQGITITEEDAPLLEKLPPHYRAILEASGSYDEIGKTLGIKSVGTVRSRLSRARTALLKLRNG